MPIIKRECLEDGFAQINNTLLQREDLAYDTKGLLCELLSRPDDWEVIKCQLIRPHTGLSKLNRMLKEAQQKGYMKVEQIRRPDGTIAQNVWFVASQPRYNVDEPKVVKTEHRLNRTSVNPPLQIKTNTKKEKDTKKEDDSKKPNISSMGSRDKIPPLPEWVAEYGKSIGFKIDGERFCDFYGQKGWLVGKTRMKDWQCAVRNWRRMDEDRKPPDNTKYTTIQDLVDGVTDFPGNPSWAAKHWTEADCIQIVKEWPWHDINLTTLHHLDGKSALEYVCDLPRLAECRICED